jgi:hypothetical protein
MAASPVAQLDKTKGDRDCNTGEVTHDVQDVQSDSQGTVAVLAVVDWAAGHDGESRCGIPCEESRLAVVTIVRGWTWVTAGGWLQVDGFARTDVMVL